MTGNDSLKTGTLARLLVFACCLLLLPTPTAQAGPADTAKKAEAARDWTAAANAWAEVLEGSPKNRDAALGLARTAPRAGLADHYPTAEDSLRDLVAKNPKDADALVALGRICLATSAAKKDTLAKKSYDVEAKQSFEKALKLAPTSDAAAAGLAQTYYQTADFEQAIQTVDTFLARKPEAPARALFWKGQTLYLQGRDAFVAGDNQLTDEARAFFSKAQGAYQGSVRADGSEPDAWIQLAYASAYLGGAGNIETAGEAYVNAAKIDGADRAPLSGLQALYTHTPAKYEAALKDILEANPKHAWALWHAADQRYRAQDWQKAREYYARYAEVAEAGAPGFYAAGLCAAQAGDADAAERLYYKALALDPTHAQAAAAIQKRIMDSGAEQLARSSPKGAQAVIAQFEPLLKAAPDMAWLRNNVAFMLREAYGGGARGGNESAWRPVLKASTRIYTEAAEALGEWTAEKARAYDGDWGKRYAEAQIISDTGLMYQYYEATRDFEKAERYYQIALEYTDDGYRDAFNNYALILQQQERWQELYDLAVSCAESITNEDGSADERTRGVAAALAKKLLADGKAK